MPFVTRCVIAILTGIGAGVLGFGAAWYFIQGVLHRVPHMGLNLWLLIAIFVPGTLIPMLTFRALSVPAAPAR